jgi:ubiquinone/menaquinone biosynthesis C-methylase UbiE
MSTRDFYEELYSRGELRNPALEIYDRLRAQTIQELIASVPGPVLIVGCGSHLDFEIRSPDEKIVAFDLSHLAMRNAPRDRVDGFVADATCMPLPNGYFNLVICSEVLEHIADIRSVVREIHRVLQPNSTLVVSSPNWHSCFGLARWLGEKIAGRPFHASDQPYDDWKTLSRYRRELSPQFRTTKVRGVWFLPPLHYQGRGVPKNWMRIIYAIYSPLEWLLSRITPSLGHMIVLQCQSQEWTAEM